MDTKDPLVTIIIPVYNAEKYIEQCVSSIIDQTYRNIEVVLVNDGSKDNSAFICDELALKDKRITVIHKENGGASDARNAGLKKARGEWVIFEDSDDYWDNPEGLEKLVKYSQGLNYSTDFIIFNYSRYFQKENILQKRPDYSDKLLNSSDKEDKIKLLFKNSFIPAPPWGKMLRADFLKERDIDFIKGTTAEDISWFICLLEKCQNFSFTNIRFHVYRKQVPGAITNTFSAQKYQNLFSIVEQESFRLREKMESEPFSAIILSFLAYEFVILMASCANFRGANRRERMRELRKLDWLLEFDMVPKVRIIRKLSMIAPLGLVCSALHFYVQKVVNRQ
jgi:glycosyltransferase involved in cell wall biosynthesis